MTIYLTDDEYAQFIALSDEQQVEIRQIGKEKILKEIDKLKS